MSNFFGGDMSESDRAANAAAVFYPARLDPAGDSLLYSPPCLEIAGVQLYFYLRNGIVVVSLHFDGADTGPDSPIALYGRDDCVPVTVLASDTGPAVWAALPDNAITEADHRLLRKASEDRPGDWVLPGWLDDRGY